MKLDRPTIAAVSVASALSVVSPQMLANVEGGTRDLKVLKDRGGVPLRNAVPAPAVVRAIDGVRAERGTRVDGVLGGDGSSGRRDRVVFGVDSLGKAGRNVGFGKNPGRVLEGEDVSQTDLGLEPIREEAYSHALEALINDRRNGRLFSTDARGVASLTGAGLSFVASRLPRGIVLFATRGEVMVLDALLRQRLDLRECERRVESQEGGGWAAIGKARRTTRRDALSKWAPQPRGVSLEVRDEALRLAKLLQKYPEAIDPEHPKNKADDGGWAGEVEKEVKFT